MKEDVTPGAAAALGTLPGPSQTPWPWAEPPLSPACNPGRRILIPVPGARRVPER